MFEVSHSTMRPSRPDLLFRSVFVLRVVEVLITEIHLWWERRRNRVGLRLKSVCCTAHNESSSQYASKIYDIYMQIGSAGDTTLPAGISRKTHLNEISPARWPQYYTRAARYSAQRGSILVLMLLAHLWQICLKRSSEGAAVFFFPSCSSGTAQRAAAEALAGFDAMPAGARRKVQAAETRAEDMILCKLNRCCCCCVTAQKSHSCSRLQLSDALIFNVYLMLVPCLRIKSKHRLTSHLFVVMQHRVAKWNERLWTPSCCTHRKHTNTQGIS